MWEMRTHRAVFCCVIVLELLPGNMWSSQAYHMSPMPGSKGDLAGIKTHIAKNSNPVICPWFPVTKKDLDHFIHDVEDGGQLQSDHPGFNDVEYQKRRRMIADQAFRFRHGDKLPTTDYTQTEQDTWKLVYEKLRAASKIHAVEEYNDIVSDMEHTFGYGPSKIPQLQDVSDYLESKTGWTLRPAPGLFPSRSFLNGLAFRVFHSTQYLRHSSRPFYTPEPDIVHEYIGHAPLLADPDFAALSQEIGLASLGASDQEIRGLASCYWFSVEFGLCRRRGGGSGGGGSGIVKAYGAGVLSSLDELLHACTAGGSESSLFTSPSADLPTQTPAPPAALRIPLAAAGAGAGAPPPPPSAGLPELRPWDPMEAADTAYPITTLQPRYYVAESLDSAKAAMRAYCAALPRPFSVSFDAAAEVGGRVVVDRHVVRGRPPAAK